MSATKLVVQGAAGAIGGGLSEPTFVSFADTGSTINLGVNSYSCKLDSSGNIYIASVSDGGLVVKYDKDLNLTWSKVFKPTSGAISFRDCIINDSGTIYAVGQTSENSFGSSDALAMEINSSGSIVRNTQLGNTATDNFYGCALDSSGALYSVGELNNTALFIKHKNTDATPSLDYAIKSSYSGTGIVEAKDIVIDGNDNVYIGMRDSAPTSGAGGYDFHIVKTTTNPSGNAIWQKTIGTTGTESQNFGHSLAVDASGNVYAATNTNDGFIAAKLNSSGTSQWTKAFEIPATLSTNDDVYVTGAEVDSNGNMYVMYNINQAYRPYANCLLKLDSTGSVVWGRRFSMLYIGDQNGAFAIDENDDIVVAFRVGADKLSVGKLPQDGSGTGAFEYFTYTDFTPDAKSVTVSVNTPTTPDFGGASVSQKSSTSLSAQTRTHTSASQSKLDLSYSGITIAQSFHHRWSGTTSNLDFDLYNLGLQEDDLVVLFYAIGGISSAGNVSGFTGDYTQSNDGQDVTLRYLYKVMGSTPDTKVTFLSGTGNTAYAGAIQGYVLRGVDTTNPLDVSATSKTHQNGHLISPNSITPTTAGALILVGIGFGHDLDRSVRFQCDNLDTFTEPALGLDTEDVSVCTGFKSWSSGTFQPSTVTVDHTNSAAYSAASWTLAFRPAS